MGSAQRQEPRSPCSDDEARTVFRNELTACLTLTAPVGMTEEAKRDWFAVAWDTLKHLPPSVLVIGARHARLTADHPSKIVPAIMEGSAQVRSWHAMGERSRFDALPAPEPEYCDPAEASKILEEYGLKPNFDQIATDQASSA